MQDLPESGERLRELLAREDWEEFTALSERQHPHAIAEALQVLDQQALWTAIRHLPQPLNGHVFSHLELERQARLIAAGDLRQAAEVVQHMSADDRVDLIQKLDHGTRRRLLSELDPEVRRDIERLAIYKQGTAGAVMSTDVATLQADQTVEQSLQQLRRLAAQQETIYYNYVVDPRGKLLGIVSLRGLLLAEPTTRLADLMSTNVVAAWVDDDQAEVARMIREYDLLALPILHGDHRLAGVVTVDDALDVSDEEATEDFHRMASVGHLTTGLREAGVGLLYRKRIPWLLGLLFFNLFSGAAIARYEATFTAYASLVIFLTLLIDCGGNAGAQSATLMIRALATGDVGLKDWFWLLLKEMAVALAIGLTMAAGVALIGAVRAPEVMVVVSLTMVCTVFIGSLIGMLLPFVLARLRLDPATASAPLITSVADIAGVLIYFGIANWYLGIAA